MMDIIDIRSRSIVLNRSHWYSFVQLRTTWYLGLLMLPKLSVAVITYYWSRSLLLLFNRAWCERRLSWKFQR